MRKLWLLLLFTVSTSQAAEFFEYGQSARALGMGGAFTAVVDDSDSLMYNPAGLAKVKGINFTLLDANVAASGTNITDISSKANTAYNGPADLEKYYGDNVWLGLGGKAAFVMPYFGIGYYLSGNLGLAMHDPAFPTLEPGILVDHGFVGGLAIPMGFASFGLVGKRITRIGSQETIPIGGLLTSASSSASLASNFQNTGTGYGADLGLNFSWPSPFVTPTVAFVCKDAGYTTFTHDSGNSSPPAIVDNRILGLGIEFNLVAATLTAALDYTHINDNNENFGKKIHGGVELSLPLIDIRAGFNQGYYTYGAGIDLWLIRFDVASYGVEKGVYPGQDQDRRYMAELTMELGFDPDFKLTGQGGRPRKLKQRR